MNGGHNVFTNTTVSGNSTVDGYGHGGGAVANNAGTLYFGNSAVSDNHSGYGGGAVYTTGGGGTYLSESTFSDNSALLFGGALVSLDSLLWMSNSIVTDNNTPDVDGNNGGGVYAWNATVQLLGSTLSNNHAGDSGAGIFGAGGTSMYVSDSTVFGNSGATRAAASSTSTAT